MLRPAEMIITLGAVTMRPINQLGQFMVFTGQSLKRLFFPMVSLRLLAQQIEFVGHRSLMIVILAGIMVGAIFGFQLAEIFRIFGAESLIGAAAGFTLSKELAPVVSSMLVAGRAGSSMAAEIATMRVNEQIDAMRVMAVNPFSYLIAPRVGATVLIMPVLSALFVLSGVSAAYVIGVGFYNIDVGVFFEKIRWIVRPSDVLSGLEKAAVFGFILSVVGCYKGFYARGGAKGVGEATTSAVVISMVLILVSDFFISYFQLKMSS